MSYRKNDNDSNNKATEQYRKLFIGRMSYNTTEDDLRSHFEKYGEIVDIIVMRDKVNPEKSRGFGFVTYLDAEMVDEAQRNRPHEVSGRELDTKRAVPRDRANDSNSQVSVNRLFVGGLNNSTVSEDDLREYFESYGTIKEVEIAKWKDTGKSRGFGYVSFEDYDPVDKAILYAPHVIKGHKSNVEKAIPRDKMNERKGGNQDNRGGNRPRFNSNGNGGGNFNQNFQRFQNDGYNSNNGYNRNDAGPRYMGDRFPSNDFRQGYKDSPYNDNQNRSFGSYQDNGFSGAMRNQFSHDRSNPYSRMGNERNNSSGYY